VLDLRFGPDTQLVAGSALTLLQASSIQGAFDQILFSAGYDGVIDFDENGNLVMTMTTVPQAVPAPGALLLLGTALVSLGLRRRPRTQSS
jgi:hypothetical protein